MVFHAFFYCSDPEYLPGGPASRPAANPVFPADPAPIQNLASTREVVEAVFPGSGFGRDPGEASPDPVAQEVLPILANNYSTFEKVATLLRLAKTLKPDQRLLAYAGASLVCGPQEFQQLILPLVWDPATPPDQAQVLAGVVVGLPDSLRLPVSLTFLRHRDESVRMTGQAVMEAYFPDVEESSYAAAVQAYLANPDR